MDGSTPLVHINPMFLREVVAGMEARVVLLAITPRDGLSLIIH
jgi:hypothetical protein